MTDFQAHLEDLIPDGPGSALGVGEGSEHDAAWLSSVGYDVVAARPASLSVRSERPGRHPDPRVRWIDDRLPELSAVHRLGISFDLILAIAVWMRILPATRPRAFRKLVTLL